MATRIIHRRGKGIPKASDFASVGEILIDTETGTGYTLREPDNVVVPLGGDVSVKSDESNIDGGNAASVYTLDQVINGGSA